MISNTQDPNPNAVPATDQTAPIDISNTEALIEAQTIFIQQWLAAHSETLGMEAWQWLGAQPMSRYVSGEEVQRLLRDWLLAQPMNEAMRADIKDILRAIIYHPINDNVPLSELVDDSQVAMIAGYISSHDQQRDALIHTLVGNETFADLLTTTLYHAINDFMESTLNKAGGVGKLMKMGRSSFEKATNKNLDDKLQAYLHRNIKDLTRRAEANAKAHLTNEEVTRLLITGWERLKDWPVSEIQTYLDDDPDNNSIDHIEAGLQRSYNRLRLSPYLRSLADACASTWYDNHKNDTIAKLGESLMVDDEAMTSVNQTLVPLITDAINSEWLGRHIREMLTAFYQQPDIQSQMRFGRS